MDGLITRATSRFESRSESRSECHRRQARPEARRGSQAARPSRGARRPPRSSPVRPPPDPACGPSMHRRLGGRNAVESGDSRATLGRGTRPHRSLPPPCSSLGPARLRCPCRVRRHSQEPGESAREALLVSCGTAKAVREVAAGCTLRCEGRARLRGRPPPASPLPRRPLRACRRWRASRGRAVSGRAASGRAACGRAARKSYPRRRSSAAWARRMRHQPACRHW